MTDTLSLPERKYIKRRDDNRNHSWQFQFELDPIKESKVFSDSRYGSKEASFQAAKEYRDDFIRSAFELGLIGPDGNPPRHDLPVILKLSPKNTSGIIGVYRENLVRKGSGHRELAWVANYQDENGKNKQKSFYIPKLGEREALIESVKFRRDYVVRAAETVPVPAKRALIERHIEDLNFLIEYISLLADESELFFFLSTLNNPLISATEKEAMLALRIGQARFRSLVLSLWSSSCAVTQASQFLVAGHIKPWSLSNDSERLDPYNGLALSPVYDKAFDTGLITFKDTGDIVVSERLRLDAPKLGITGRERIHGLRPQNLPYLEFHRTSRYQPR
jgi:HNH endonuclease